jgi:hypothetical protein
MSRSIAEEKEKEMHHIVYSRAGLVIWGVDESGTPRKILVKSDGTVKVEVADSLTRTNRTKTVEVDLTSAHTDEALGLEVSGRVYRWLTIERCDDSLNYKLKQTDGTLSDIFRAYESARIWQHDFLDIIVSNPIGTGVCRFVVGYWEG